MMNTPSNSTDFQNVTAKKCLRVVFGNLVAKDLLE